jgi:hypothetical protein
MTKLFRALAAQRSTSGDTSARLEFVEIHIETKNPKLTEGKTFDAEHNHAFHSDGNSAALRVRR